MSAASDSSHRGTAYLAFIAVCVLWGTTYLGIRIALETIPPALLGGLRYTAAGLLLSSILGVRAERHCRGDGRHHAVLDDRHRGVHAGRRPRLAASCRRVTGRLRRNSAAGVAGYRAGNRGGSSVPRRNLRIADCL